MKNTRLFSLIMTVLLGLAVWMPQKSQASGRSKKVGDCVTCKRPVYSYRHFQTYSRGKPVYTWKVSGHGQCQPLSSGAELVKHEVKGKDSGSKTGAAKKAEAKKTASHEKAKKQPESKAKHDQKAYAQHGGQQAPQAYGGGSGYGGGNYGTGYGGQGYGNPFHSGYGNRQRVYGGSEFGYGYGNGTVTSRTTITRSTPSTLGSVGGGFSGTSTRTYTSRTRTNYRGSYGRIWGGSTYRSRPHASHY